MKKNILAIAILAAVIANIILSSVTLFSIVPTAKATNKLIEKICTVINLDLENPDATSFAKVPVASRIPFQICTDAIVNLKRGENDKKDRMAVKVECNIIFNKDAAGYSSLEPNLANHAKKLSAVLDTTLRSFTADELLDNEVKSKIEGYLLSYFRTYFREDDAQTDELVVDLTLTYMVQ